jgi:hypothetical protein
LNDYLYELQTNTLPLPLWGVSLFWLLIFCINHMVIRRIKALAPAQASLKPGDPANIHRSSTTKSIALQALFAAVIFAYSHFAGGFGLVLLAGGWVVTTSASLAGNISGWLLVRAFARSDAAPAFVRSTASLGLKQSAFQLLGMAAFCLAAGVLTAHLALLGGALFIAASGIGQLRMASRL